MATYVALTRVTPESVKTPADLKRLEKAVAERIRKDCPHPARRSPVATRHGDAGITGAALRGDANRRWGGD